MDGDGDGDEANGGVVAEARGSVTAIDIIAAVVSQARPCMVLVGILRHQRARTHNDRKGKGAERSNNNNKKESISQRKKCITKCSGVDACMQASNGKG